MPTVWGEAIQHRDDGLVRGTPSDTKRNRDVQAVNDDLAECSDQPTIGAAARP